MAVEQSTQSLIRKKSCPILEYWRPISSLSEVLLTPHSRPPRPQGGFPHWKQSTWILIRKNSCPISEYSYIADFQSPSDVLCNARLSSIHGHRLQFEGPLDPTLIQTEFFVHDKVQMDLTGQLSQSFKNIGNQDFFSSKTFTTLLLLYIGIAFFNLLPSIFQWGNPPCGLRGRPCAVRRTSLRLEIGRQYSDIGAYYNNGTDLPRQYLISRRYLRCLENVMKWQGVPKTRHIRVSDKQKYDNIKSK